MQTKVVDAKRRPCGSANMVGCGMCEVGCQNPGGGARQKAKFPLASTSPRREEPTPRLGRPSQDPRAVLYLSHLASRNLKPPNCPALHWSRAR